jgi:radical SAM protein with 4Fe4S-binding SPASM domain
VVNKNFKPKRLHVQWHITEKCNLNCKHCYKDPDLEGNELSFSTLKKILRMYVGQLKKWGINRGSISFMGGEPFMRTDFFDLLKECQKYSEKIDYSLSSNGTLIDRKTARELKEVGVGNLQVSLEGRERVNDSIRGKGVFKRAVKAIKILRKENIGVSLSVTVSKQNIKEVPHMIKLAQRLDIGGIGFRRIVPLGNSQNAKSFLLSPEETQDFYKLLLKEEKRTGMNLTGACEMGLVAQEEQIHMGCPVGFNAFIIMPDGGVFPCRRLPVYAGNVLKDGFEKIYYNSKIYKELRDIKNTNEYCGKCPYFLECRGGAKCINYAYYGDAFKPDPQCWRIFNQIPPKNLKVKKAIQMETEKKSKWISFEK